jgi:hypothetical protein
MGQISARWKFRQLANLFLDITSDRVDMLPIQNRDDQMVLHILLERTSFP